MASIDPLPSKALAVALVLLCGPFPFPSSEVAASSGEIFVHNLPPEWHSWKAEHGKKYESVEEEVWRQTVWEKNMRLILEHNAQNETHGYTLRMNHLGDLTDEEYKDQYRCVKNPFGSEDSPDTHTSPTLRRRRKPRGHVVHTYQPPLNASAHLPDIVDWHTKGAVTGVKSQGQCCSCYAFSVVAAVEGSHALATGELVSLSEQNVVDCSGLYGNHGCQSGQMDIAFEYIIDTGGLNTEQTYPYDGVSKRCRFNKNKMAASMSNYQRVRKGDENDLQAAVAMQGPVVVAVDASHNTFRFYESGVFDEPHCSSENLTHAMTIVGYGSHNGKAYWLIKNSWGTSWGDKGYIMMVRNRSNQCGIASNAIFPTL